MPIFSIFDRWQRRILALALILSLGVNPTLEFASVSSSAILHLGRNNTAFSEQALTPQLAAYFGPMTRSVTLKIFDRWRRLTRPARWMLRPLSREQTVRAIAEVLAIPSVSLENPLPASHPALEKFRFQDIALTQKALQSSVLVRSNALKWLDTWCRETIAALPGKTQADRFSLASPLHRLVAHEDIPAYVGEYLRGEADAREIKILSWNLQSELDIVIERILEIDRLLRFHEDLRQEFRAFLKAPSSWHVPINLRVPVLQKHLLALSASAHRDAQALAAHDVRLSPIEFILRHHPALDDYVQRLEHAVHNDPAGITRALAELPEEDRGETLALLIARMTPDSAVTLQRLPWVAAIVERVQAEEVTQANRRLDLLARARQAVLHQRPSPVPLTDLLTVQRRRGKNRIYVSGEIGIRSELSQENRAVRESVVQFYQALEALFQRMPEAIFFMQAYAPEYFESNENHLLSIPAGYSVAHQRWLLDLDGTLREMAEGALDAPHLFHGFRIRWEREQPYVVELVNHDAGHFVDVNGGISWKSAWAKALIEQERAHLLLDPDGVAALADEEEDLRAEVFRVAMRARGHPTQALGQELFRRTFQDGRPIPLDELTDAGLIHLARSIVVCEILGPEDKAPALMKLALDPHRGTPLYDHAMSILNYVRGYVAARVYDPTWVERFDAHNKTAPSMSHAIEESERLLSMHIQQSPTIVWSFERPVQHVPQGHTLTIRVGGPGLVVSAHQRSDGNWSEMRKTGLHRAANNQWEMVNADAKQNAFTFEWDLPARHWEGRNFIVHFEEADETALMNAELPLVAMLLLQKSPEELAAYLNARYIHRTWQECQASLAALAKVTEALPRLEQKALAALRKVSFYDRETMLKQLTIADSGQRKSVEYLLRAAAYSWVESIAIAGAITLAHITLVAALPRIVLQSSGWLHRGTQAAISRWPYTGSLGAGYSAAEHKKGYLELRFDNDRLQEMGVAFLSAGLHVISTTFFPLAALTPASQREVVAFFSLQWAKRSLPALDRNEFMRLPNDAAEVSKLVGLGRTTSPGLFNIQADRIAEALGYDSWFSLEKTLHLQDLARAA